MAERRFVGSVLLLHCPKRRRVSNKREFTTRPPSAPHPSLNVFPCDVQDVCGRNCAGLVPGKLLACADRGEDRLLAEHDVQGAHAAGKGGPCAGRGFAARVDVHDQVIDAPAARQTSNFKLQSSFVRVFTVFYSPPLVADGDT